MDFVLVPMLILLYPQESPEVITSISLAVVFFNALSGSLAYMRLKRVDYRSGLLFAAATIPGAILGALTTSFIPRPLFDIFLGVIADRSLHIFDIAYSQTKRAEGGYPQEDVLFEILSKRMAQPIPSPILPPSE